MDDTTLSPAEALPLAQLLFKYREWADDAKLREGLTPEELRERDLAMGNEAIEERVTKRPPDQVKWSDLNRFFEIAPDQGLANWQAIKRAARDDWQSGFCSASLFRAEPTPYKRATYLAIRASMVEDWQPANGIERALIEMMAQTYSVYMFWLERFTAQSSEEGPEQDEEIKKAGSWQPPRLSVSQSLEQSAAMVDRFNRLFLRTLRTLRDLRRYSNAVVIANAGQVNVGGQQVNLAQQSISSDKEL